MTGGLLVVGLGNPWRGDDGAGPAVARALGEDARVLVHEGEPIGVIDAWADAEEVILVDAVRTGGPPGTVHRIDPLAAGPSGSLGLGSTHAFGLAETIALARALGRLPARLTVYGVEGRCFGAGAELSPPVATAVARLSEALRERLAEPGGGRAA